VEEALGDVQGVYRVPVIVSLQKTLEFVASAGSGSDALRRFAMERPQTQPAEGPREASGHLVRLAVFDRVLAAWRSPGGADVAAARDLAVETMLVSPVSGAVVLERQEQYARHDLSPTDAASVPIVPEPATVWLLALGALAALRRRRQGRGRSRASRSGLSGTLAQCEAKVSRRSGRRENDPFPG
jgi:hypothetical protein